MFKPNCQAILFRCTLQPDGSCTSDGGTPFDAFLMEHFKTGREGAVEDHSQLLLEPEASPAPGDEVEIKGLRRTIARVRCCTGVNGTIKCYRCFFLRS